MPTTPIPVIPSPCSRCGWQYTGLELAAYEAGERTLDPTPTHMCLPDNKGNNQLQDLYGQLDKSRAANSFLAWYAQCRAKEMSHHEAILDTKQNFNLYKYWWKR